MRNYLWHMGSNDLEKNSTHRCTFGIQTQTLVYPQVRSTLLCDIVHLGNLGRCPHAANLLDRGLPNLDSAKALLKENRTYQKVSVPHPPMNLLKDCL